MNMAYCLRSRRLTCLKARVWSLRLLPCQWQKRNDCRNVNVTQKTSKSSIEMLIGLTKRQWTYSTIKLSYETWRTLFGPNAIRKRSEAQSRIRYCQQTNAARLAIFIGNLRAGIHASRRLRDASQSRN